MIVHTRNMAAKGAIPLGPTGDAVRANVQRLREAQNLGYAKLAAILEKIKRPIPELGLRRIESGDRRVDVDDLMALAVALGVSPVTLLMPAVDSAGPRDKVTATAVNVAAPPGAAAPKPVIAKHLWQWLTAEYPVDLENLIAFAARAWPRWQQDRLTAEMAAAQKALEERVAGERAAEEVSSGDD